MLVSNYLWCLQPDLHEISQEGKEAPDCLQPIFDKNPDQKDITALE